MTNTALRSLPESKRLQLVHKLQNQDASVIEELYDLYSTVVYGIAYRIVRSPDLAATVMQDTFCKVWKYGADYNPDKGGLFAWIVNIARNTAIDVTRTRQYKNAFNTSNIEDSAHTHMVLPEASDAIGVAELADKLGDKYLILLKKYYFQGYTHTEMVNELGIPLGTVKTRLRTAVSHLRDMLRNDLGVFEMPVNA